MDDKKPAQGFWGALEHVVEHLYDEELRHYLDTPPEERDGHIFESFFVLSCFHRREVHFSRYELLKLLRWPDETRYYRRLATSLRRWKGLVIGG